MIFSYMMFVALFHVLTVFCLCLFVLSQDAHELFHVLTSSLDEERDRQPKIVPLFDMQSLEASFHVPTLIILKQHTHALQKLLRT